MAIDSHMHRSSSGKREFSDGRSAVQPAGRPGVRCRHYRRGYWWIRGAIRATQARTRTSRSSRSTNSGAPASIAAVSRRRHFSSRLMSSKRSSTAADFGVDIAGDIDFNYPAALDRSSQSRQRTVQGPAVPLRQEISDPCLRRDSGSIAGPDQVQVTPEGRRRAVHAYSRAISSSTRAPGPGRSRTCRSTASESSIRTTRWCWRRCRRASSFAAAVRLVSNGRRSTAATARRSVWSGALSRLRTRKPRPS